MKPSSPARQPDAAAGPRAAHTLLRNLLNTLILLQSHLRLVGETGANTVLATSRLFTFFEQLFAGRDSLTIAVARHGFLADGTFVERTSRNVERFAEDLFQHGIATLTVTPEVTPQAIHLFLRLVSRKPAETWDEGGMAACLRTRQVAGLTVGEMSEELFALKETEEPPAPGTFAASRLWEKYVLALAHGLHLGDAVEGTPAALAAAVAAALREKTEAEKAAFARHASRFLLALKHETVRSYRDAAVGNLAAFINELSPDLRLLVLTNVFNLNIDGDLAADFTGRLSDQSLLEALKSAASGKSYAPPVILRLLGKLAGDRGLSIDEEVADAGGEVADDTRMNDFLRADGFADYVPERYQNTLLRIVNEDILPTGTRLHLDRLKETLEPAAVEDHLGRVLLQILRQVPEAQHLTGMHDNLRSTLEHYLAAGNFARISELLQTVASGGETAETADFLVEHVSSPPFAGAVVEAVGRVGRAAQEEIAALILQLRQPFVTPLFDRLDADTNRSSRLFYLRLIKQLGPLCIDEALRRLADARWYVTRNMLFVLRDIGTPALLPEIRRCLQHPHPKVRHEALATCLHFGDRGVVGHLLRGFAAKREGEALKAVMLAAQADDPQIIAGLLEIVQTSALFDYRLELRRAAVRSLAAHAAPAALPVFARLLASKDLLHPHQLEELKLEIIAGLDRFPPDQAGGMLREQLRSGSAKVARLARLQLQKMTEGKR